MFITTFTSDNQLSLSSARFEVRHFELTCLLTYLITYLLTYLLAYSMQQGPS